MKKIILASALVVMALGSAPLAMASDTYFGDRCGANTKVDQNGSCSQQQIIEGLGTSTH